MRLIPGGSRVWSPPIELIDGSLCATAMYDHLEDLLCASEGGRRLHVCQNQNWKSKIKCAAFIPHCPSGPARPGNSPAWVEAFARYAR